MAAALALLAALSVATTLVGFLDGGKGDGAYDAVSAMSPAGFPSPSERTSLRPVDDLEYIRQAADTTKVDPWNIRPQDMMGLTYTTAYADGFQGEPTVENLWKRDADGDGQYDNLSQFAGGSTGATILYGTDDSAWLVGRATVPAEDMHGVVVTDYRTSRNDDDGIVVKGIEYDARTGLVYVPRSAIYVGDDGFPRYGSTRLQVFVLQDGESYDVDIPVRMDVTGDKQGMAGSGLATIDAKSYDTRIKVTDGTSRRLSSSNVTGVTVNGTPIPEKGSKGDDGSVNWAYEAEDGVIDISTQPTNLTSVEIAVDTTPKPAVASVTLSLLPASTYASGVRRGPEEIPGTWTLPAVPVVGNGSNGGYQEWYLNGTAGSTTQLNGIVGAINALLPVSMHDRGEFEKNIMGYITQNWKEPQKSEVESGQWYSTASAITRTLNIPVQTTNGITVPVTVNFGLQCAHVEKDFQNTWGNGNNVFMRAMQVAVNPDGASGAAIVAIVCGVGAGQAGAGYFWLNWKIPPVVRQGQFDLYKRGVTSELGQVDPTNNSTDYSYEGAQYTYWKANGTPGSVGQKLGTITTDRNGYAVSPKLDEGWYWVHETKAPRGFYVDKTHGGRADGAPSEWNDSGWYSTYVRADKLVRLNEVPGHVEEPSMRGSIGVKKSDAAGRPLGGAVFTVWDSKGNKVGTITTGDDGNGRLDGLALGWYWVRETKAPAGFRLDDSSPSQDASQIPASLKAAYGANGWHHPYVRENPKLHDPSASEVISWVDDGRAISNSPIPPNPGKGQVRKTSSNPALGLSLAGAVFGIYGSEADANAARNAITVLTTDRTGMTPAYELEPGTYYVKETKAPAGFSLNASVFTLTVKSGETATIKVEDRPETTPPPTRGRGKVKKTSTVQSTPVSSLAGAEFGLYRNEADANAARNAITTLVTGKTGETPEYEVDTGTYYVKETKAPEGFLVNTRVYTLVVPEGGTAPVTVTIADAPKPTTPPSPGKGRIRKVSSEPGSTLSLAGAEFGVYGSEADANASRNAIAKLITDETGMTPEHGLDPGTYYVKETKAPEGFLIDPSTHEMRVTAGSLATVTVEDTPRPTPPPQRGLGMVQKVSADGGTNLSFEGAEFGVYATRGDAEVGSSPLGKLTSKRNGITGTIELEPGTYYVRETKAPDGFEMNDEVFEVAIKAGETSTVTIADTRLGGKAQVLKANADATGEMPPAGAEFGVYGSEDDAKAGRDAIKTLVTGKDGKSEAVTLAPGTYYVKETKAPEGFLMNGDVLPVTVKDGETALVTVKDQPVPSVDVSKNEVTGGPEIPGAHLEIRDSDGNVVEQWTSTSTPHRVRLVPGRYTLTEVLAPRSYEQAETVTFTVTEGGSVQRVEMHDAPISISAQIDKIQEVAPGYEAGPHKGAPAGDDKVYSYSLDYRSTSSTWVDEFTVEDPLDAVHDGLTMLESVTTARAYEDHDGKMNVWYQTDRTPSDYADDAGKANATKDDGHANPWLDGTDEEVRKRNPDGDGRILSYVGWRLWKRDVSSTEATELPVSDLHLADGERVTAVRFEYGRVERGFTTRVAGWDRDDLKDVHDSSNPLETTHQDAFLDGDGTVGYAPAVMAMRLTGAAGDGGEVRNSVHVDAYRNGGGEGLEGHDQDRVAQVPVKVAPPTGGNVAADTLVQTGDDVGWAAGITAAASLGAFAVAMGRRCRAGR